MSNVRFYRLGVLPNFAENYQGIFVHVTEVMQKGDTQPGATLQMGNGKVLNDWLTERHIESIASGLWFGGKNGWELLTNDTSSGAITAAIEALDVDGYEQATIDTTNTESEKSSSLTIKGIQEVDGRISNLDSKNISIAIDGVYNRTNNKIATQDTVKNAIEGLDTGTVQAVTFNTSEVDGNTTLTFKGVKEMDGIIYQGDDLNPSTVVIGDAKLNIQIGSDSFEVFSANAQSNGAIKLNENVFKKDVVDGKNVLSVITPTDVASDNRLVTEKDIASLNGAMHYKGTVSSLADFEKIINNTDSDSDAEKAGNVYIATGEFTHGDNVISTGDMIVFNGASNYNVIQSNLTLGIDDGQIAKNNGNLKPNNMVIATSFGIKTIEISETDLTDTTEKNKRTLDITNGTADGTLYHDVTILDTFKVIGKDFTKSINVSSTNRSIEIAQNGNTGVMVDLVWNTSIE